MTWPHDYECTPDEWARHAGQLRQHLARNPDSVRRVICKQCGEPMPDDALPCPNCGTGGKDGSLVSIGTGAPL